MPTRSRNLAAALGGTIANNVFGTDGSRSGAGITVHDYDSNGALLLTDNSSFVDGSLHYLTNQRELYVWDDNESKFYPLDEISDDKLEVASAFSYQGSTYGYAMAGASPGTSGTDIIDKFPFANSTQHATDVGDLTIVRVAITGGGIGSSENGYALSGVDLATSTRVTTIDKFPFASDANAALYSGNLLVATYASSTATDGTNGYNFGGRSTTGAGNDGSENQIQKFNYAVEADATDVGDLTVYAASRGGHSSSTHGYSTGSYTMPYELDAAVINKFPFATDADATDIGVVSNLNNVQFISQSSATHGYVTGGGTTPYSPTTNYENIWKFSFASDADGADVADIPGQLKNSQGVSSTDYGYVTAGYQHPTSGGGGNSIFRFAFASDGNLVDTTADVTVGRDNLANTQV